MVGILKKYIVIIFSLSIIYAILASLIDNVPFISIIIPVFFMFVFFFGNVELFKNKKMRYFYLILFFCEIILLLYNAKYKNLPLTDMDWMSFDDICKNYVLANSKNLFDIIKNSMDSFVLFMSLLYRIFGYHINMMYFYIFPLTLVIFRYSYNFFVKITNKENRSLVFALLMNLWPISFLFSFALLREIPAELFVTLFLYNFIFFIKDDKNKYLIGTIAFSLLSTSIHSGLIGIFLVSTYVILQKRIFKDIKVFNYKIIITVFLISLIVINTPIWNIIGSRFEGIDSIDDILSTLIRQNEEIVANTGYIKSLPKTFLGTVLYAPYRAIMFEFSPFIWQVYDFRTLLSLLFDSLWRIIIWIYIIRSIKINKNNKEDMYIIKTAIMILVTTYFIFGMGVNNYGTALRHRSKITPIELSIVCMYGFYRKKKMYSLKTKSIAYLRSTSIVNDSRATKEIRSYLKKYSVMAFGWNRQNIANISISYKNNDAKLNMYNIQSEYGGGKKNALKFIKFEIWLYKNLKENIDKFDTIHCCDFDTALVAYIISCRYDKKIIYDIYDYYVDCHNLSFLKGIVEIMDINVINNSDKVIICTEYRKKQILKSNPEHLVVIHNSPELPSFKKTSNDKKKLKICYVGVLQPDRLIIEICEAISKNSDVELHIGGFGKYENEVKNYAKNFKNIIYYGQMNYDDVLSLENKCDILFATYNPIIPNHRYSAPNKVYEAMALGKPIIVCKDTGVDDLVAREKIGYVINYDANEFINCIKKIKKEDFDKIKLIGQKIYKKKYSWQIMEKKLLGNNRYEKI